MLACHGRYSLDSRDNTELLTVITYCKVFLFHVATLRLDYETSNLEVRESENLSLTHNLWSDFFERIVAFEFLLEVHDVLHSLDKPRVNLSELIDALDGVTLFQSLCDSENAKVGRVCELFIYVVKFSMVIAYEAMHTLSNHTETLLKHFFERATDGHNLTYRLH